jgi:parallel beta-helix repeat protein
VKYCGAIFLDNNVCRNNTQYGICMTGDASGNPSNGKMHHNTAILILKGLLVTATQRDKDVERATAPILAENARLITRAEKTEAQRDEMLR